MTTLEDKTEIENKFILNGYYKDLPENFNDLRKFGAEQVVISHKKTKVSNDLDVFEKHIIYNFPQGVTCVYYYIKEIKNKEITTKNEVQVILYGTENKIEEVEKILLK